MNIRRNGKTELLFDPGKLHQTLGKTRPARTISGGAVCLVEGSFEHDRNGKFIPDAQYLSGDLLKYRALFNDTGTDYPKRVLFSATFEIMSYAPVRLHSGLKVRKNIPDGNVSLFFSTPLQKKIEK
jgi:hypothetical protein